LLNVSIIFGDGENLRADTEKVIPEVETKFWPVTEYNFVDVPQSLEEGALVDLRHSGRALLVGNEDVARGEADDEAVAEGPRLAEELYVAAVEDIVATGDEDGDHVVCLPNRASRIPEHGNRDASTALSNN
jgi:hypothetical protein